jgi:hypothetical protein
VTEIFATAAACAGALVVAGTGIAVLPWTEREHRAVLGAFATMASLLRAPLRGSLAIVRGSVERPSELLLSRRSPPGVLPWNSSFPLELTGSALRKPSIASSPGTAAT